MDFSEFIGFIISMLALLFLMLRQSQNARRRKADPEKYRRNEEQREKRLKDFLRSLEGDLDEQKRKQKELPEEDEEEEEVVVRPKPRPVAPPPVQAPRQFRPALAERKFDTNIENRQFSSQVEDRDFRTRIEDRSLGEGLAARYVDPYHMEKEESAYVIKKRAHSSRVRDLLLRQDSVQDFIIIQEIIGRPKGLQ